MWQYWVAFVVWVFVAITEGTLTLMFTYILYLYKEKPFQLKVMAGGLWLLMAFFITEIPVSYWLAENGKSALIAWRNILFGIGVAVVNILWAYAIVGREDGPLLRKKKE